MSHSRTIPYTTVGGTNRIWGMVRTTASLTAMSLTVLRRRMVATAALMAHHNTAPTIAMWIMLWHTDRERISLPTVLRIGTVTRRTTMVVCTNHALASRFRSGSKLEALTHDAMVATLGFPQGGFSC
jgi:hypothetical protein